MMILSFGIRDSKIPTSETFTISATILTLYKTLYDCKLSITIACIVKRFFSYLSKYFISPNSILHSISVYLALACVFITTDFNFANSCLTIMSSGLFAMFTNGDNHVCFPGIPLNIAMLCSNRQHNPCCARSNVGDMFLSLSYLHTLFVSKSLISCY